MNEIRRRTARRAGTAVTSLATLALSLPAIVAQTPAHSHTDDEAAVSLPDDPGLRLAADVGTADSDARLAAQKMVPAKAIPVASGATPPEASRMEMLIEPGQAAATLTPKDKVLAGAKDSVSLFSAIGWFASAGYEQLLNGSPNYGTDRGAFGERLGTAAIRDISDDIFSESIMAPVLHEDARYYRLGPAHNFFARGIYAATRTIVTRTDSGRTTPNFALLSGTLAGSALTNFYYPPINHGAAQTFETFGGSLGGDAVGNLVSEFFEDVTGMFHKHN